MWWTWSVAQSATKTVARCIRIASFTALGALAITSLKSWCVCRRSARSVTNRSRHDRRAALRPHRSPVQGHDAQPRRGRRFVQVRLRVDEAAARAQAEAVGALLERVEDVRDAPAARLPLLPRRIPRPDEGLADAQAVVGRRLDSRMFWITSNGVVVGHGYQVLARRVVWFIIVV